MSERGAFSGLSLSALAGALVACSGASNVEIGGSPAPTVPEAHREAEAEADAPPPPPPEGPSSPEPKPSEPPASRPPDARLFPVEVGRSWSYSGSTTSKGVSTSASYVAKVTGRSWIDGRNTWVLETTLGGTGATSTSWVDVQGDDVYFRAVDDAAWLPTMRAPVVSGKSWSYSYRGTRLQTWKRVPAQTVPAGTFADCWQIDYVVAETSDDADVNYSIACRGVGTVRQVMQLANGYEQDYSLRSKNF